MYIFEELSDGLWQLLLGAGANALFLDHLRVLRSFLPLSSWTSE